MRCMRWVLLAAVCVGLGVSAWAETQDIRIGGDILMRGFYKNEWNDLGADYDVTLNNLGQPKRMTDLVNRARRITEELSDWRWWYFGDVDRARWDGTAICWNDLLGQYGLNAMNFVQQGLMTIGNLPNDNDASWFDTTVRLYADVDLTDNVTAFVRLLNERDWNGIGAANSNPNVSVDLAYMTMADFFGYPLECTLGRQEILIGEGFLIGDGFGHNTALALPIAVANQQTLVYAKTPGAYIRNLAGGGNVTPITYGSSSRKAFDAVRFSYMEDPMSVDVFGAKLIEGGAGLEDDRDMYGVSLQYDYFDYGEFGVGLFMENGARSREVYALSLRGKTELPGVSGLVLKGEIVPQYGQAGRYDADGNGAEESVDQGGLGGYVGLWYFFEHELAPYVGVDYVYMSGDDDPDDESLDEFYPFAEDEWYGEINETAPWGLDTNLQIWNLGAGFRPTETTSVALDYYDFTLEDPAGFGVVMDGATMTIPFNLKDSDFGKELDVEVAYDYTEDVQFALALAWFDPGKALQKSIGDDKTVTQVVGSVKVSF